MKLYYYNDELKQVNVFVDTFHMPHVALAPKTGAYFEVDVDEDQVLFVKRWDSGIILLSAKDVKSEFLSQAV